MRLHEVAHDVLDWAFKDARRSAYQSKDVVATSVQRIKRPMVKQLVIVDKLAALLSPRIGRHDVDDRDQGASQGALAQFR